MRVVLDCGFFLAILHFFWCQIETAEPKSSEQASLKRDETATYE